jgi:hypothetical protein
VSSAFKSALWYLGALAVLEALGLWVMDNYERVRVPEWVGYSGEARENDFLAAQRFFYAMGRSARSVKSVYTDDGLPGIDGTIIVTSDRRFMSPFQQQRLIDWVKSGGELIVEPNSNDDSDQVMQAISVGVYDGARYELGGLLPNDFMEEPENWVSWNEQADAAPTFNDAEELGWVEGDDDEDEDYGKDDEHKVNGHAVVTEGRAGYGDELLHVPGTSELFKVNAPGRELSPASPGDWQIFGRDAAFAVREPLGDGMVTVATSLAFLRNQQIAELDHAPFVWAVLQATGHTGEILFINGVDPPPLWITILKRGWPALVAIALAVILALWHNMPRVGAPIAPLAPIRRELMEHVDASGRFLLDHGAGHVLIESVQRHVRTQLLKRYPQYRALPERERRMALAKAAKLSQADVDALYRPQVGLTRNDFVVVQRLLERISHSP